MNFQMTPHMGRPPRRSPLPHPQARLVPQTLAQAFWPRAASYRARPDHHCILPLTEPPSPATLGGKSSAMDDGGAGDGGRHRTSAAPRQAGSALRRAITIAQREAAYVAARSDFAATTRLCSNRQGIWSEPKRFATPQISVISAICDPDRENADRERRHPPVRSTPSAAGHTRRTASPFPDMERPDGRSA